MTYDKRHGGPYDRGSADAYYGRAFSPHYYTWPKLGMYAKGDRVEEADMTDDQIEAYRAGFEDQVQSGDFKDWGR